MQAIAHWQANLNRHCSELLAILMWPCIICTNTLSSFYIHCITQSLQKIFCFSGVVPVSNFISNLKNASCDLKHNSLGPKGMHAVARALIQNNYVTELLLRDNALQPEGSVYVAKLLLENFNITKLDVSENEFGSVGAHNMARILKGNNRLQSMNLSKNLLKDKDASSISEALQRNSGLRILDLSRNAFSEEAGHYFGKFYSSRTSLIMNQFKKTIHIRLSKC